MRVLITGERAEPLASALRAGGAWPVHVPLLALVATGQPAPAVRAGVVLVSSAAAVRFAPDLAGVVGAAPVVAVGAKTAAALRAVGIVPAAVGRAGGAAAVALLGQGMVLHIGAAVLSPQLAEALQGRHLIRWKVYRRQVPAGAAHALAAAGPVDAVTFASGSAARTWAALSDRQAAVVVLGPSTAEDARAAGLSVAAVAEQRSLQSLARAALSLLRGGASGGRPR